jgi:hypothetical protein
MAKMQTMPPTHQPESKRGGEEPENRHTVKIRRAAKGVSWSSYSYLGVQFLVKLEVAIGNPGSVPQRTCSLVLYSAYSTVFTWALPAVHSS